MRRKMISWSRPNSLGSLSKLVRKEMLNLRISRCSLYLAEVHLVKSILENLKPLVRFMLSNLSEKTSSLRWTKLKTLLSKRTYSLSVITRIWSAWSSCSTAITVSTSWCHLSAGVSFTKYTNRKNDLTRKLLGFMHRKLYLQSGTSTQKVLYIETSSLRTSWWTKTATSKSLIMDWQKFWKTTKKLRVSVERPSIWLLRS